MKPSNSESTPESADNSTTLVMVYRYGLAESPEILNGLSSSFIKSAASFNTLFATISSSFLCGFCSICKYKLICSVIKTERFLYFLLIFVPNVINRNINIPSEKLQNNASTLYRECKLSRSLINSKLTNDNSNNVTINTAETITSTDRCGPLRFK